MEQIAAEVGMTASSLYDHFDSKLEILHGRGRTAECARPDRTGPLLIMATDYDASRKSEEEQNEESLEALRLAATDKDGKSGTIDEDETEAAESYELPGADLSNEQLSVEVVPKQDDEFTCSVCFLVHHRSARMSDDPPVCRDCA